MQGYEGHLQHLADPAAKAAAVQQAMTDLVATAAQLRADGHMISTVTTGGTGTCALCAAFPGVTEVQPGSFIFMDRAYRDALGAAHPYQHALVVLATVISRPAANRAVLDAGLKALSTDMGNAVPCDLPGLRYRPGGDEHGILEWDDVAAPSLAVGDLVRLIPSHIDTTVNLYDTYYVHQDAHVITTWPISARGRVQ